MRLPALLIVLGMAVFSAAAARGEEEWKRFKGPGFTFSAPASLKEVTRDGTDSVSWGFVGEKIVLGYALGGGDDDFDRWPKEIKFETLKVDGREAKLGMRENDPTWKFRFEMRILIPVTFKVGDRYVDRRLGFSASFKTEKEVALARKIFESIRFSKE
jgi:hypothetical protein